MTKKTKKQEQLKINHNTIEAITKNLQAFARGWSFNNWGGMMGSGEHVLNHRRFVAKHFECKIKITYTIVWTVDHWYLVFQNGMNNIGGFFGTEESEEEFIRNITSYITRDFANYRITATLTKIN